MRWPGTTGRLFGLLLVVTLLVSACGPREEIVYIDAPDHAKDGTGAYTPVGRSTDPLVHADGAHEPAADVQIGPGTVSGSPTPYAPIASSGGPLVHAGGTPHAEATITLANEHRSSGAAGQSDSTRATGSAPTSVASALTAQGRAVAEAAASPTPPARLSLGPALGVMTATPAANRAPTSVASALVVLTPAVAEAEDPTTEQTRATPTPRARLTPGPALGATPVTPATNRAPSTAEGDDDQATVAGRIESIVGPILNVKTSSGTEQVRLSSSVRVERDALGTPSDLKPGQFVGVIHTPSGPAASIRLYTTGPSMPRAGVVPMVGSRQGQVTTFGSIVMLQFGGLVLNTGGETTAVTIPSGVEILRPTSSGSSELSVGAQVMVTGRLAGDGSLVASAVRVTAESRPGR